jgi:spoIIIJ-associated protein
VSDTDVVADDSANAEPETDDVNALLVQEGDIAADYLEHLRAIVAIVGTDLQPLVGKHGETLDALQELTRLAVQQKTGSRSRLMLDVSGHRAARRTQLSALAAETAATVLESGEPARLAPMNPFERKVVHDAVAAIAGVHSASEGEEPNRRVVILIDE